jgi:hypothetical protein
MSAFHPLATEQRTQFYVGFVPIADLGHRDARKSRVRARYPRVATAGGSPSLNFTPTEKILMLAFEVPV